MLCKIHRTEFCGNNMQQEAGYGMYIFVRMYIYSLAPIYIFVYVYVYVYIYTYISNFIPAKTAVKVYITLESRPCMDPW